MITVNTTYPDGETSQGRYAMTLDAALVLICDVAEWPDGTEGPDPDAFDHGGES